MTVTIRLRLSADLDADPYLLARLLSVCARRRVRVERVHYEKATATVELTAAGPAQQARRLGAWLDRQLHVRVETTAG